MGGSEESEESPVVPAAHAGIWVMQALSLFGCGPHVELEVDTNRQDCTRFLGGIYMGPLGCQILYDGKGYHVYLP
jgi:hypothetical protein